MSIDKCFPEGNGMTHVYHRKGAREKREAKEKLEKMDEGNICTDHVF